MKLKTSNLTAIEKGKPDPNSFDIELLGTESLSDIDDYKVAIKVGSISSSTNSFISIFGTGVKLFYNIEHVCEVNGFTERGIGYIEQRDSKFYLKRSKPFFIIQDKTFLSVDRIRPIVCDNKTSHLIITSYVPTSVNEVLTDTNSVITSQIPHIPTSIVVDEYSVLGRTDSELTSIPMDSLVDEEKSRKSVTEYTKTLSLKSSKVDVKRLATQDLQLNPRSSAPERKGVLYYDENDDCLKYYDGTSWRLLVWKQD